MLVKVKVFPKEKQNAVVKKNNDTFEVKTTALPINNEANKAVCLLLAQYFGVPLPSLCLKSN